MERVVLRSLEEWKNSSNRKPLLFQGARQVGKTWLLKEFGRRCYGNVAYINLDHNEIYQQIFEHDFNLERILIGLQLSSGQIIVPGKTLVILDEIQESPRALTCLKYFCEEAPEYHVAAAGSYLGVATLAGTGFPVGKVNKLILHPMSYLEFLEAMDQGRFADLLRQHDWKSISLFQNVFQEYLRYYYFVGGMPEVVAAFANNRDFYGARKIQLELLGNYEKAFGKHVPKDVLGSLRMVWESVPGQLAKENKKFQYSQLQKHARKTDFEEAIQWLCAAGFLYRVERVTKPALPLMAYHEAEVFKLYGLDVGLLAAQSNLDPKSILEGNRIFTEFKGALTEQYVHQQILATCNLAPYYWASPSNEVDFIFQQGDRVLPLEVKAESNLRARSLMYFCRKYAIPYAIRTSMLEQRCDWTDTIPSKSEMENCEFRFLLENLPLYAISEIQSECERMKELLQ